MADRPTGMTVTGINPVTSSAELRDRAEAMLSAARQARDGAFELLITSVLLGDQERVRAALAQARDDAEAASRRALGAEKHAQHRRAELTDLVRAHDALSAAIEHAEDRDERLRARAGRIALEEELAEVRGPLAAAENEATATALASQQADWDVDRAEAELGDIAEAIADPFRHPRAVRTEPWEIWAAIDWPMVIQDPMVFSKERRIIAAHQLRGLLATGLGYQAAEHEVRARLVRDATGKGALVPNADSQMTYVAPGLDIGVTDPLRGRPAQLGVLGGQQIQPTGHGL
jgi:hypothetical protein